MSYTISLNKKREPQARNEIYQKQLNVGCPYCKNSGRKKNFKTLWVLYMHFREHHKYEERHSELIRNLADLVIEGVLL